MPRKKFLPRAFAVPQTTLGLGLGLIGVLIFATTLPVTVIGLNHFSPQVMSLGRALIAALFALPVVIFSAYPKPTGRQWFRLAGVAIGIVFGFPVCSSLAMQTVPASHAAVVLGFLPLCTALCGTLLLGERPSFKFWFWALTGSVLVLTFVLYGTGVNPQTDFALQTGDLWLLAAILMAGFGYTVGGGLSREMPGWLVVSRALVISMPFIFGFFICFPPMELAPSLIRTIPLSGWAALFWVALMSQFIGFFFWNAGLAKGGVASVGQLQLLQIFFTLGFSALLPGEEISAQTLAFACAVCGAVIMGRRALNPKP